MAASIRGQWVGGGLMQRGAAAGDLPNRSGWNPEVNSQQLLVGTSGSIILKTCNLLGVFLVPRASMSSSENLWVNRQCFDEQFHPPVHGAALFGLVAGPETALPLGLNLEL